mgnify:CR=1 FL=1
MYKKDSSITYLIPLRNLNNLKKARVRDKLKLFFSNLKGSLTLCLDYTRKTFWGKGRHYRKNSWGYFWNRRCEGFG